MSDWNKRLTTKQLSIATVTDFHHTTNRIVFSFVFVVNYFFQTRVAATKIDSILIINRLIFDRYRFLFTGKKKSEFLDQISQWHLALIVAGNFGREIGSVLALTLAYHIFITSGRTYFNLNNLTKTKISLIPSWLQLSRIAYVFFFRFQYKSCYGNGLVNSER